MCDDFFDDGFEHDFEDEFSEHSENGVEAESRDACEGWFLGDDLAFALLGGAIGCLEEEIEERKRLERKMEQSDADCESCRKDYDVFNPDDQEPFP